MKKALLAAAIALLPASAFADAKINGWTIEKIKGDAHCSATRSYKDKDDDNARNFVGVYNYSGNVDIVLAYQHWEWDKGEVSKAKVTVDGKPLIASGTWTSPQGGAVIVGSFTPDTAILPVLSSGKSLTLTFTDGDADFEINGLREALGALKACEGP